ncbi:ABC transporter permease [Luedemannella flava]
MSVRVSWASWRTALRIARREARRAKGRTALVAVMIGLPVAGLTTAAVTYDMFTLSAQEQVTRTLGAADATMSWVVDGPITQEPAGDGGWYSDVQVKNSPKPKTDADLLAVLPAGSRVAQPSEAGVDMRTAAGTGLLNGHALDVADPIYAGYVTMLRGRPATAPDEVALSEKAVQRLGADVDGTVTTADRSRTFRVVGIVEFPDMLHEHLVFAPGALPVGRDSDNYRGEQPWFVTTPGPVTWDEVKRLNALGIMVRSRAVLLDPPVIDDPMMGGGSELPEPEELALGGLVAGMCVLEVVLLAGPAFAVGARRRQRQLAIVAASGGTGSHVRRIVLADGVVLGLFGAACGVALGVLVSFGGRQLAEEYLFESRAGGYRVFPLALVAIVALAVITGLLAALVPAFVAARQPVVAALQGRRGITRSLQAVVGARHRDDGARLRRRRVRRVAHEREDRARRADPRRAGPRALHPALVGLIARIGGRLPVAPRIALRDSSRNRASAAPAISAVMAAVAGSMAMSVFLGSSDAQNRASYAPTLPYGNAMVTIDPSYLGSSATTRAVDTTAVAAAMRTHLPASDVLTVSSFGCAEAPTNPGSKPLACGHNAFAELPPERRCPFATMERELTLDEQKVASRDERCDGANGTWASGSMGTIVADGAPVVSAVTGATGDDLARAVGMLKRGGVVVTDPKLIKDGAATVLVDTWREGTDVTKQQRFTIPHTRSPGPRGCRPSSCRHSSPRARPRRSCRTRWSRWGAGPPRSPRRTRPAARCGRRTAGSISWWSTARRATGTRRCSSWRSSPGWWRSGRPGWPPAWRPPTAGRTCRPSRPWAPRRPAPAAVAEPVGRDRRVGRGPGRRGRHGVATAVLFALNRVYAERWPSPALFPITVPWANVAILAIAIPAVAMLGAGLLTRSRLPIERRPE